MYHVYAWPHFSEPDLSNWLTIWKHTQKPSSSHFAINQKAMNVSHSQFYNSFSKLICMLLECLMPFIAVNHESPEFQYSSREYIGQCLCIMFTKHSGKHDVISETQHSFYTRKVLWHFGAEKQAQSIPTFLEHLNILMSKSNASPKKRSTLISKSNMSQKKMFPQALHEIWKKTCKTLITENKFQRSACKLLAVCLQYKERFWIYLLWSISFKCENI